LGTRRGVVHIHVALGEDHEELLAVTTVDEGEVSAIRGRKGDPSTRQAVDMFRGRTPYETSSHVGDDVVLLVGLRVPTAVNGLSGDPVHEGSDGLF